MTASPVVLYEPDKGAGYGHAMRHAEPERAWRSLQSFLDTCADVNGPEGVSLRVYHATEWDDPRVSKRVIDAAHARFGRPDVTTDPGVRLPSGEPVLGGDEEWRGGTDELPQFLEFLIAGGPWPRTTIGPVAVAATYRFLWRDPDAMEPLQEQVSGHFTADGALRSELVVSIQRRSFVQPVLWFPYPPGDSRLTDLVRLVAPWLPFKLSSRHFRVAVPQLKARRYRYKRFDASALLAV